jgi:hypothetical protein
MKKAAVVLVFVFGGLLFSSIMAQAGDWRFPFGVSYINGVHDVEDQLEDNLRVSNYDVNTFESLPVGLSFQPYYEFDSGLGLGLGFGPFIYVFGDADYWDVPVNVCLRYAVLPKASITPYIRVGASDHIAGGDYYNRSNIGFIGAVGLEFMRNRAVNAGIEVGYDSSSVELEDLTTIDPNDSVDIKPVGFTISVFAVF